MCKDCDKRVIGCHAACQEYQAWSKKRYEDKAKDKMLQLDTNWKSIAAVGNARKIQAEVTCGRRL